MSELACDTSAREVAHFKAHANTQRAKKEHGLAARLVCANSGFTRDTFEARVCHTWIALVEKRLGQSEGARGLGGSKRACWDRVRSVLLLCSEVYKDFIKVANDKQIRMLTRSELMTDPLFYRCTPSTVTACFQMLATQAAAAGNDSRGGAAVSDGKASTATVAWARDSADHTRQK